MVAHFLQGTLLLWENGEAQVRSWRLAGLLEGTFSPLWSCLCTQEVTNLFSLYGIRRRQESLEGVCMSTCWVYIELLAISENMEDA